jgi:hypothetical protein
MQYHSFARSKVGSGDADRMALPAAINNSRTSHAVHVAGWPFQTVRL